MHVTSIVQGHACRVNLDVVQNVLETVRKHVQAHVVPAAVLITAKGLVAADVQTSVTQVVQVIVQLSAMTNVWMHVNKGVTHHAVGIAVQNVQVRARDVQDARGNALKHAKTGVQTAAQAHA